MIQYLKKKEHIYRKSIKSTHPSFSKTGSNSVFSFGFAPTVEITSKKCFTASMCFSVQNFLYNCPVYSSLHGCCADLELTKLPNDCMVFDIRVKVRFVWKSYEISINVIDEFKNTKVPKNIIEIDVFKQREGNYFMKKYFCSRLHFSIVSTCRNRCKKISRACDDWNYRNSY